MLPEQTTWLEERCDEVNATLAPLKSFVLPGGTRAAAHLHVCRTVCRRAERAAIACGEDVSAEVVRYLNRLSDLLFILSRGANDGDEPLWEPGRYREHRPPPARSGPAQHQRQPGRQQHAQCADGARTDDERLVVAHVARAPRGAAR